MCNNVFILHIKRCCMRKVLFLLSILFWFAGVDAQLLSWSPQFSNDNSTITITVDATRAFWDILVPYICIWVITNLSTNNSDWRYVTTTWGTTTAPVATSLGNNKWSFTLTNPRVYFNTSSGGVPAGSEIFVGTQMGGEYILNSPQRLGRAPNSQL